MLEVKIKVFQKFFATKIQNPGGSSLTKVLTRDCLSLVNTQVKEKEIDDRESPKKANKAKEDRYKKKDGWREAGRLYQ